MNFGFAFASVGVLALIRTPGLLIGAGVCALVAVILALVARSNMRKQQRLADTETTRTGRLKGGFSEVKGKARTLGELLHSPLSKTRCIYFHFLVEEHVQRGKNSYWKKVVNDKQNCGLLVDDGSGPAAVRLGEADLYLKPDAHAKSGTFNQASPELEAAMQEYGRSTKGWIFNKNMRYTETFLRDGDDLYVIGNTAKRADGTFEFEKAGDLFIVSDESEEKLAAKFNQGKLIGIIGGALTGVGAVGFAIGSFFRL